MPSLENNIGTKKASKKVKKNTSSTFATLLSDQDESLTNSVLEERKK